jgi:hypothetical protein
LKKVRIRREILKSKIPSRRWVILDSFLVTELNETPLLAKRMNGASIFSPPEVVWILQKRERASALFIPR